MCVAENRGPNQFDNNIFRKTGDFYNQREYVTHIQILIILVPLVFELNKNVSKRIFPLNKKQNSKS